MGLRQFKWFFRVLAVLGGLQLIVSADANVAYGQPGPTVAPVQTTTPTGAPSTTVPASADPTSGPRPAVNPGPAAVQPAPKNADLERQYDEAFQEMLKKPAALSTVIAR